MPHGSEQLQSVDIGETEIKDHEIRPLRQKLERLSAVRRIQYIVSLRGQPHAQELADGRLIVDDQDLQGARAHATARAKSADCPIGSVMVNTAPDRSVRF